jgi:hypothetical protein
LPFFFFRCQSILRERERWVVCIDGVRDCREKWDEKGRDNDGKRCRRKREGENRQLYVTLIPFIVTSSSSYPTIRSAVKRLVKEIETQDLPYLSITV